MDGGGSIQERCFLLSKKLVVEQLYTDVQVLNSAMDGGGSMQERCFSHGEKLGVEQLYTDVQLLNSAPQ